MSDTFTGLPGLPKGYFWRVRRGSAEYLRLQMRKKTWFGSAVVEWSVTERHKASPTELREAASCILRKLERRSTQGADWKKYLGDYPPKMLPPEVSP